MYDVSSIKELIEYFNDFEGTEPPFHAELTQAEVDLILEALSYYKEAYNIG